MVKINLDPEYEQQFTTGERLVVVPRRLEEIWVLKLKEEKHRILKIEPSGYGRVKIWYIKGV